MEKISKISLLDSARGTFSFKFGRFAFIEKFPIFAPLVLLLPDAALSLPRDSGAFEDIVAV